MYWFKSKVTLAYIEMPYVQVGTFLRSFITSCLFSKTPASAHLFTDMTAASCYCRMLPHLKSVISKTAFPPCCTITPEHSVPQHCTHFILMSHILKFDFRDFKCDIPHFSLWNFSVWVSIQLFQFSIQLFQVSPQVSSTHIEIQGIW